MAKKIPRMGVSFVAYAGVLIARCINLWRAVPSILLSAHAGNIVITSPITEKLIVALSMRANGAKTLIFLTRHTHLKFDISRFCSLTIN